MTQGITELPLFDFRVAERQERQGAVLIVGVGVCEAEHCGARPRIRCLAIVGGQGFERWRGRTLRCQAGQR
jgi:hypothetical protein